MCGIAGFYHPTKNFMENQVFHINILSGMAKTLQKRGPDDHGSCLSKHCGLAHTRLAVIDLSTGHQPITYKKDELSYSIIYNGELYNTAVLKNHLKSCGCCFQTTSDAEVILLGFIRYGADFVRQLNGVFAFAIMDEAQNRLYLFRDRIGVKPLFYTIHENTTIFASELKALFAYPGIKPKINKQGLNEIFSLGPAKTPGSGIYYGISEVLPGHYLTLCCEGLQDTCYWQLEAAPHTDDYAVTLDKVRFLVTDAIKRQMVSDVPICTFLSGGVDSSIVSAVCAEELAKQGKTLNTFSFDFTDNDKHFKSNAFQPSLDRPYVDIMADYLHSDHHYLECSKEAQADLLYDSVLAHDLPSMADIDSSMLYFCSVVKDYNRVVLTGECADEIFGGYPWFHRKELMEQNTFPWTVDLTPRKALLKDDFTSYLQMEDYVDNAYYSSLAEVPEYSQDTPSEKRLREISYLNLKWFMQTLLDRMDRTSMYSGVEARVPFADYHIIEYLFNAPWEMKAKDGVVKNLLRSSCLELIPHTILFRKKCPYPKTYDPNYEKLLAKKLSHVMEDSHAPILAFVDRNKISAFLTGTSDYGKPWYGQLMAGPQMIAYLLQINYWLEHYKVEII